MFRTLLATGTAGGACTATWWAISGNEDTLPPLSSIPRTLRAVSWATYAAYDYGNLARQIPDKTSSAYKETLIELHNKHAMRLLHVCERNGGVYTKAAQFGSALQAIPPEYRTVLEKLQDKAPPRPFDQVKRVISREFGQPIDHLFVDFDPTPAAAASLAQVHRATLQPPQGPPLAVAVKVQYEGLAAEVHADLAAARALSAVVQWLFPEYDAAEFIVGEIGHGLARELDFLGEVRNAQQLASTCSGQLSIAVPHAYPQLCSQRVLTMEWIDGCKISDVDCIQACNMRAREVALALTDAIAYMTFQTGNVHADPHAGNILVRPRPQEGPLSQGPWLSRCISRWFRGNRLRPQLVFLDHGTYVHLLPDTLRQQYCQLWCAFVLGDAGTAQTVATAMVGERAGRVLPEVLRPRDWSKVPQAERKKLRQEVGMNSLGDVSRLLEECPKPLVEVLRIGAMVRPLATQLGMTVHDRLRINATHAIKGMAYSRETGGRVVFLGAFSSRRKRWRLSAMIWAMRSMYWVADMWGQLLMKLHIVKSWAA